MGLFNHIKAGAFGAGKKKSSTAIKTSRELPIIDQSESAKNDHVTQPKPEGLQPLHVNNTHFAYDEESYAYPSLFEEADGGVKLSNLTYALIELRDLAGSGKLDEHPKSLTILQLPLPFDQALSILATEAEILKDALSDGTHDASLSALQSMINPHTVASTSEDGTTAALKSDDKDGSEKNSMIGGLLNMFHDHLLPASSDDNDQEAILEYNVPTITAVGDENSNTELVYVVGINPASKRITVSFRGSTTATDFVADAKMDMVRAPDPRMFETTTATESSPEKAIREDLSDNRVCIHQGFYEYLFGTDPKKQSKYAEIMAHIQGLYDSNPIYYNEYNLYITGHSLGGALATLFGFYASASSSLPQPVTVVSVASPRVGNIHFARTFALFESEGKIRHLRVANHKDPITLGPTISSKRALVLATMAFSPLGYLALKLSGNDVGAEETTYYHTGIKMKLRKDDQAGGTAGCELSYSGAQFFSQEKESGDEKDEENAGKKNSMEMPLASYHYGSTYSERMAAAETDLVGLTLNQLYVEKTEMYMGKVVKS